MCPGRLLVAGANTSRLVLPSAPQSAISAKASTVLVIIASMREVSNSNRISVYFLRQGKIGISLLIPNQSRTKVQRPMPSSKREFRHTKSSSSGTAASASGLMAVFKIHLENANSMSSEVGKLVEWIHRLHSSNDLELSDVFQGNSTGTVVYAPWSTWAGFERHPWIWPNMWDKRGKSIAGGFSRNILSNVL
jgi:hypothetical protein